MQLPNYDAGFIAASKIALDAAESVRRLVDIPKPVSDLAVAMATIRSTALDMKARIGPFPTPPRRVCEHCEAKDARIDELEQERSELINMLPESEESSGA
ncbi:hypothetical protein F4009_18310 [Candidatus Poribacteria bacterium]|nr:hypothetical protein [Gemmatimonadota bacterium]MYK95922.1 hypothetical protein [Candidatus Poribacteria bacterium]